MPDMTTPQTPETTPTPTGPSLKEQQLQRVINLERRIPAQLAKKEDVQAAFDVANNLAGANKALGTNKAPSREDGVNKVIKQEARGVANTLKESRDKGVINNDANDALSKLKELTGMAKKEINNAVNKEARERGATAQVDGAAQAALLSSTAAPVTFKAPGKSIAEMMKEQKAKEANAPVYKAPAGEPRSIMRDEERNILMAEVAKGERIKEEVDFIMDIVMPQVGQVENMIEKGGANEFTTKYAQKQLQDSVSVLSKPLEATFPNMKKIVGEPIPGTLEKMAGALKEKFSSDKPVAPSAPRPK